MHGIRRYVIAVAAIVLAMSAGLALPAQAGTFPDGSTWCSDGAGPPGGGQTEIPILTSPITVALELGPPGGPQGAPDYATVCYSTAAVGNSAPTPVGGNVQVSFPWSPYNTPGVLCYSDANAVVKPNCNTFETLTAQDPNPNSTGNTVTGQVYTPLGTVDVFQTGAEAGNITTPGGGATSTASLGGTCLWVLGTQMLPSCTGPAVGATIANGDLPQLYGGICAVQSGNTCVVGVPGVQVGGDTANPTVNVMTPLGTVPLEVPCVRALQTGAVVVFC